MTVKKTYNIKDIVWIYGITRGNSKPTLGTVVSKIDLSEEGYGDEPHYIISIPTSIEDLLEIRTWETMSQDALGPVGSLRATIPQEHLESVQMKAGQLGLDSDLSDVEDYDDPTPDQIHAAMARSEKAGTHAPLVIKDAKPKRRYPPRKKKA